MLCTRTFLEEWSISKFVFSSINFECIIHQSSCDMIIIMIDVSFKP